MLYDAKRIKELAYGRWDSILAQLLPQIDSTPRAIRKHQPCPVHGGKDGFRLFNDYMEKGGGYCNTCGAFPDGFSLIQSVLGMSFRDTLKAVYHLVGETVQSQEILLPRAAQTKITHEPKINLKAMNAIQKVLDACQPVEYPSILNPVHQYLIKRGLHEALGNLPNDIRYHKRLAYMHEDNSIEYFPAMISTVRLPNGLPINIHRTYLTSTGSKAPVPMPKKLMSSCSQGATTGCAIQLYPCKDVLAIAEGIETALAISLLTGLPTWSTINANNMRNLIVPASVKKLYIFADKDLSLAGQNAAKRLAERYGHISVEVLIPKQPISSGSKSVDWNDVFNQLGGAK